MQEFFKGVLGRIIQDVKEYGMAAVAVALYTVVVNLIFHAFCPLIIFCGFPCPGCGVSRATACFITGRWQQAWQMNPVVFPIMLCAAYFCLMRYLLGRKVKGMKVLTAIIMVLLAVVYCIRMYLYFPERVPYVYTEANVLARVFPFYHQILHEWGIVW
ncbi:MAG: DUF2752 domain-containing protein [Lachnospiraceae bacterium]|nr:DUF2752 domain-containing protein [Lachnospiraceae bacterium]